MFIFLSLYSGLYTFMVVACLIGRLWKSRQGTGSAASSGHYQQGHGFHLNFINTKTHAKSVGDDQYDSESGDDWDFGDDGGTVD